MANHGPGRVLAGMAALLVLAACSPVVSTGTSTGAEPPVTDPPEDSKSENYPTGWQKWEQINEVTRAENSEVRELYASARATGAPYPMGSLLVKAHFRLAAGAKGTIFQLSVMRKVGGKTNGGWEFEAYDPNGKAREADADVCVMCHSQRAANDFVFSER